MQEFDQNIHQEEVGLDEADFRKRLDLCLSSHGITFVDFVAASPEERMCLIMDRFDLKSVIRTDTITENDFDPKLGFVVIKPEAHSLVFQIEQQLKRIGLKIINSKSFFYTPEDYWSIYGKTFIDDFDKFQHGSLLFLLGINLPSKIIFFEHKGFEEYWDRYLSYFPLKPMSENYFVDDAQKVFDYLFVRMGEGSLRRSIVIPEMSKTLQELSNRDTETSRILDFTGSFGQRDMEANLRTFNGVHSPSNNAELKYNGNILKKYLR